MTVNALGTNYYGIYESPVGRNTFDNYYSPSLFEDYTVGPQPKDGKDDGKISFGSKVKNFFKGIGNTIKGAVKSLATPKGFLKAAACVALCAIPGVGPIAATALGAIGVVKGVTTVVKGAKAAHNATTDAEAEAAWQNIGSGTFQVAVSRVAMKAGLKGIKAQGGWVQTASVAKQSLKTIGGKAQSVASTARTAGSMVREAVKGGAKFRTAVNDTFDAVAVGNKYLSAARSFGGNAKAAGSMVREAVKDGVSFRTAVKDTLDAAGVPKFGFGTIKNAASSVAGDLGAAASMVKEAVANGMSYSEAIAQTASALGVTPNQVMIATTTFANQL